MGKLILQRYSGEVESTQGALLDADKRKFLCYIMEDEHRDVKVKGETRIWAGTYELRIRREDTPLTLKYRQRYPWFKYHIEVWGVEGFIGIYMHIGNFDYNTEGCLLFNDVMDNNTIGRGAGQASTQAMKRVYGDLYKRLDGGEKIFLTIRDEAFLYD